MNFVAAQKKRVHDDLLLSKSIENAPGRMLRHARKTMSD
jgi:hypothetical protein